MVHMLSFITLSLSLYLFHILISLSFLPFSIFFNFFVYLSLCFFISECFPSDKYWLLANCIPANEF